MKKIANDFIKGDSTKKLAIISDFTTILGVSVATVVAGPFLSKFADMEFIITDFILAIAFYFVFIYIIFYRAYVFSKSIFNYIKEGQYKKIVRGVSVALFVIWAIIIVFPYLKYYVGNSFNVSYLLPPTAINAIVKKDYITINKTEKLIKVEGKLLLTKNANSTEYVAILYAQNLNNSLFDIVGYQDNYQTTIRKNGEFTILRNQSVYHDYKNYDNFSVVVYRKSDWELFNMINNKFGFPDKLTSLPSNETDQANASVFKLKT